MRRFITLTVLAGLFGLVVGTATFSADAGHAYVGAKKCKTCHKPEFNSWSETGHAKAFELLSDEEKKSKACVSCHTTGALADGTTLEGVQCEVCHGPGKDYKSIKIMSKKKWKADPEKHMKMALEAGLIIPTEETCKRCHTKEGNPNFKEFKFAERVKLVHPDIKEKADDSTASK
jgi:hypothetical protein